MPGRGVNGKVMEAGNFLAAVWENGHEEVQRATRMLPAPRLEGGAANYRRPRTG